MGRSIWTSKNQIILFLLHSYLEGKPQWSLEELMLNVDIIMQLLLALLGKIKVAKSTYNVHRELKIWRSSQLSVESREDKPELEGIFPLAHCYQPFLIRRCQLGHSYLHHTFTPWPGHRRRAREGQRLPLTVSGVCLGIFFLVFTRSCDKIQTSNESSLKKKTVMCHQWTAMLYWQTCSFITGKIWNTILIALR